MKGSHIFKVHTNIHTKQSNRINIQITLQDRLRICQSEKVFIRPNVITSIFALIHLTVITVRMGSRNNIDKNSLNFHKTLKNN